MIRDMFMNDINRKINGVIKVDQNSDDVIEQELNEYVITTELKKHFIHFFRYYSDALENPTTDIGVWISGFFGSGKSHFLKMLSYLLENRKVKGVSSSERFRWKLEDDPETYKLIDRATRVETETILFNIDVEGSINKDKTAVLRVFAKTFYNHLGFFGENLKVAKLEQYIDQQGKTAEFRRVFEEQRGKSWLDSRKAFAFNGKYIIYTLGKVLDISEEDAKAWFKEKSEPDFSIAQLVNDIKDYLKTKPDKFRLLFMADEVGQYVGTDTNMLLNLQSLIEKIGSACNGKVWVVCTGQEAIDEIIKVRSDEFSRIQARFKTRLSLTSSSVDEVIQKRILKKKGEAEKKLEMVYNRNDSILRNLFSFNDAVLDIKGYTGPEEFAANFPFVPYQFIILQKVFAEIRKHGNAGKHLSGGERSMLSGFQEAAQKLQYKDENTLAPFFLFYDTVNTFLDSSIRRVIDRCQKAADNGDGIEAQDVNVLKLLYLIRYVDDIPANLDNIVILMADDIRIDKINRREKIGESLDRLMRQNYIGRAGDVYNFLTDEEQDIQRDIKNTSIDTNSIVDRIGQTIFGDILGFRKYRYGKYDFTIDQEVDEIIIGNSSGGMGLQFLTVAMDDTEKNELILTMKSKERKAIVVLADTPYYESLENAMKIRKYVKQRNISNLSRSVQNIIRAYQEEAARYEKNAREELERAIASARFYVDGEHIEPKGKDAKGKIDEALKYLVSHVYSALSLIRWNAEDDVDVTAILTGNAQSFKGMEPNREAADRVEKYLEMQEEKRLPTSMADIQKRYSSIPYGWREIDIAAVVAILIYERKVTIKYAGAIIQPTDPKLIDMLRKKSEIGKTSVSKRKSISAYKIRDVRNLLRDYFDMMDVPEDEDGLVSFIKREFTRQRDLYEELKGRYEGHKYPEKGIVIAAINQIDRILSQCKDNTALIDAVLQETDSLFESQENMQRVKDFFQHQVTIFDEAVYLEKSLSNDLSYLRKESKAYEALNQIRLIINETKNPKEVYCRIPKLNSLMQSVREGYEKLLKGKRDELLEIIRRCMEEIHSCVGNSMRCREIVNDADNCFLQHKKKIQETKNLGLLNGMMMQLWSDKDRFCEQIDMAKKSREIKPEKQKNSEGQPKSKTEKIFRKVYRQEFPADTLNSLDDVDKYVERIRKYLREQLESCDGIRLQ